MKFSKARKISALLLSVILLLACVPTLAHAEEGFVSENLLQTKIDMDNSSGISFNHQSLTVAESANGGIATNGVVKGLVDGDLETNHDIWGLSLIDSRWFGVRYALTEASFASEIKIYGDSADSPHNYDVYASEELSSLHYGANLVGSVVCDGTVQTLKVDRTVKYVMVVFNPLASGDTNSRLKEIQLWSGDETSEFKATDLIKSEKFDSAKAVLVSGETASDYASNAGNIDKLINKDYSTSHTDFYSNSTGYTGVQINLTENTYLGRVLIDAGLFNANGTYNETYTVYASATQEELYSADSIIASDVLCTYGRSTIVDINKYAQYVAVVCTEHNGIRIRNICLFDAYTDEEPPVIFVPENVLRTHLQSARCVQFYPTSYYVDNASKISEATLAKLTDGDTLTTTDCYSGLDWSPARYIGAEFTLDGSYFVGELNIYSGYTTSLDTFEVYASDSFDTLYSAASLIEKNVVCDGSKKTLTVNKNIKYVAFLISGVQLYCARIAEFEAITADPSVVPEPGPSENTLSVLTIGNSFAENASVYATEIAYANGKNLTFGYLKSPSCTIEKHYNAAVNDIAGFKFQVTSPNGSGGVNKVTVKDGADTTVDAPNAEHGATVAEALAYTDWDVIVFQQESSAARSYETFEKLPLLIEYVKTACPNAQLMFHEVWRWGTWSDTDFANIKANTERIARENNLEIIPSGLAFEYSREITGDVNYPNDNDGNYQHANTYGQYMAGVCYVNKLFGIACSADAFKSHPYINADGNVETITECANKAGRYYESRGDINFDGELNSADLVLLRNALLGAATVDTTLADVNNDGSVNIVDMIGLKKALSEKG